MMLGALGGHRLLLLESMVPLPETITTAKETVVEIGIGSMDLLHVQVSMGLEGLLRTIEGLLPTIEIIVPPRTTMTEVTMTDLGQPLHRDTLLVLLHRDLILLRLHLITVLLLRAVIHPLRLLAIDQHRHQVLPVDTLPLPPTIRVLSSRILMGVLEGGPGIRNPPLETARMRNPENLRPNF